MTGGAPRAAGGFARRWGSIDAKNAAFIAAGFCILAMGPIAEHMISSPGKDGVSMEAGFDRKGFTFGDPGELAEIGTGIDSGTPIERISELQARHPSALIISDQDPPEVVETPAIRSMKRPEPRSSGWKDAISSAGRRGVAAAARSAKLPSPGSRLAGKLNAMSSSGGGRGSGSSGASLSMSLAPPSSRGLASGGYEPRSSLSRIEPTADYRGAGGRGLAAASNGPGFFQDGRRMTSVGPGPSAGGGSGGAGGLSSGGGSGSSGGRPAVDDFGRAPGASSSQDARNVGVNQKEDLALARRKMEMEKAINHKWEKKKYNEIERKKMMEQIAMQTASQAMLKVLDKGLEAIMGAQGGAEGEKKKKKKNTDEAKESPQ